MHELIPGKYLIIAASSLPLADNAQAFHYNFSKEIPSSNLMNKRTYRTSLVPGREVLKVRKSGQGTDI